MWVKIKQIYEKWILLGYDGVMKWVDHSDYSSTEPYIDIVDDIKATSMTKLTGLL